MEHVWIVNEMDFPTVYAREKSARKYFNETVDALKKGILYDGCEVSDIEEYKDIVLFNVKKPWDREKHCASISLSKKIVNNC